MFARVHLLASLALHHHLGLHIPLTDVFETVSDLDEVALVPVVVRSDAHVRRVIVIVSDAHLSVVVALHVLGKISIPISR